MEKGARQLQLARLAALASKGSPALGKASRSPPMAAVDDAAFGVPDWTGGTRVFEEGSADAAGTDSASGCPVPAGARRTGTFVNRGMLCPRSAARRSFS